MAVFTKVSEEVLRHYLTFYDLPPLVSFEGVEAGIENTNYVLNTETDRYILTLFEGRTSGDDLPFFVDLMGHLANRDFPCPRPVSPVEARAPQTLEKKPALIVSFLRGASVTAPEAEHCRQAGEMLARLHIAAADFAQERPSSMSLPAWQKMAATIGSGADRITTGLSRLLGDELAFLEAAWPTEMPHGIIHGDFFPDNVLWDGSGISGVIDFYYACTDALAYDLALTVNAWCFDKDGRLNRTLAEAMIAGYNSARSLSAVEIDTLPIYFRAAALRILLTRTHDHLFGDADALVVPKDPIEYLKILQLHQTHAEPRIYGL